MQLFRSNSLRRQEPPKRLNTSLPLDPNVRYAMFGKVQPMEQPNLIHRLLGW